MSKQELGNAEREALELRHCTGAHRWIHLCNRTLNLVREVRRSHTEAAQRIKEIEFLRQQLSIASAERDQWDGNYCDLRLEMDKLEAEAAELRELLAAARAALSQAKLENQEQTK